jgi:hypothetical protein
VKKKEAERRESDTETETERRETETVSGRGKEIETFLASSLILKSVRDTLPSFFASSSLKAWIAWPVKDGQKWPKMVKMVKIESPGEGRGKEGGK